jgi:protocatechuate 3,4-dioxygenase beta subunit
MDTENPTTLSRRAFLWRGLAIPAVMVLAACSGRTMDEMLNELSSGAEATPDALTGTTVAQVPTLAPTPACGDDDDDDLTPAQTEGPYYTPNTPQRTSFLEPGITGTRLVVSGFVLSTDCQPVAQALIDFWHADDGGNYDNVGYKLRGHQFTDANGQYTLETILPGLYPGRTRHIHVKVQAPNQPVLTTQLYFPNEPENARDGIYIPELEMAVQDSADGSKTGAFNFVLALA